MVIKRAIFKDLKDHLSEKEITLIYGPRSAGKTTILLALKEQLDNQGQKTLLLNLEVENDKKYFSSAQDLVNKIKLEIGGSGTVFIDEIGRKEDAGVLLKDIYDMNLAYKFVVSSPRSLELKEKINEPLMGRNRLFELKTLSFTEFVHHRTGYQYEDKISELFTLEQAKTLKFLDEYLNFGGYPRVVLAETNQEKLQIIEEIYQSYIEKDISYIFGVRKTESFSNLVKILAAQIGNLVNYSDLSLSVGLSAKKVKDFLWYLEKTFILERVTPYFRNKRKEISKSPVAYFNDLGLRNYVLGLFGNVNDSFSTGIVFQNFVFLLLKDQLQVNSAKMHFWRTKDGAEVDFVVDNAGQIVPIEVKYQAYKQLVFPKSLRSFVDKYQPGWALIVNLALEKEAVINKTRVISTPVYKLINAKLAGNAT